MFAAAWQAIFPLGDVAVGALVGAGTNWLAIKALFRPRERILGWQGVIPKKRQRLAEALGEKIGQELLGEDAIRSLLDSDEGAKIIDSLTDVVMNKAGTRLGQLRPGEFISAEQVQDLVHRLLEWIFSLHHRDMVVEGLAARFDGFFETWSGKTPNEIIGAARAFMASQAPDADAERQQAQEELNRRVWEACFGSWQWTDFLGPGGVLKFLVWLTVQRRLGARPKNVPEASVMTRFLLSLFLWLYGDQPVGQISPWLGTPRRIVTASQIAWPSLLSST